MMNGAQEVGFLLLQRQISLFAIRALLSIMVTFLKTTNCAYLPADTRQQSELHC